MDYSTITTAKELEALVAKWTQQNVSSVAMDFEEESNLHCYGEHICIIQLFDGAKYYIIDCLELIRTQEGLASLKSFLEGPLEKVMFSCQSDAALARKALDIQLNNIYDIRVLALALELTGNLTSLEEKYLGTTEQETNTVSTASKKHFQTANWMRRPIPEAQIQYALGDVEHLFELRKLLEEDVSKLPKGQIRQVYRSMKTCALPKHPERPGWEKICNYKLLSKREKVLIKYFFIARDNVAKKHDVPASRVLVKQEIVAMAKAGTWKNNISCCNPFYRKELEEQMQQAIVKAKEEY